MFKWNRNEFDKYNLLESQETNSKSVEMPPTVIREPVIQTSERSNARPQDSIEESTAPLTAPSTEPEIVTVPTESADTNTTSVDVDSEIQYEEDTNV